MEGSNFTSPLQSRSWNGTPIQRRATDGYINATAMCKASGRRWRDFSQSEEGSEYLQELMEATGCPPQGPLGLLRFEQDGTLWVHPDVATELAEWISPDLSIFVNHWFRGEHKTRSAAAAQPAAAPAPAPAALPAMAMLELIERSVNLFEQLGGLDERDQLLLKDLLRNNLLRAAGGVAQLPPAGPQDEELAISDAWLKLTGTPLPQGWVAELGRLVAKRRRQKHNSTEN